jgi:kynurenine formamidase
MSAMKESRGAARGTLILGCVPWTFKGGEAAFCRAVAFVGDWTP